MKALIVSSTRDARAWIRSALGNAWTVAEAADGLEAMRTVRDDDIDIVIADESTEPFGAFGLARELKIESYPPGVVVILDRAQDDWLARWSGADRWLVQPIDPFALRRAAEEVLAALDAQVEDEAEPDADALEPDDAPATITLD